jgi:hypothetical protein
LWPGGVIRYSFGTFTGDKPTVRAAMANWTTATNNRITFIEDGSAPTRVVIDTGAGCSSGLPGRLAAGGIQRVNWANICPWQHELGHVIGLYHEHQREDRDRFITVTAAAPNCSDDNMWKRCTITSSSGSNVGEYDLSSIEQYESVGSPPDITRKDGTLITNTAQSGNITGLDAEKVVELYAADSMQWFSHWSSIGIDPGNANQPLSANLATGVTPHATLGAPASAFWRSNDSSVNVAVIGSDGGTYWRSRATNGTWGSWTAMGGVATSPVGLADGFGNLAFFIRGNDGALWSRWHYSGWGSSGKPNSTSIDSNGPPTAVIWSAAYRVYVSAGGHIWELGLEENGTIVNWRQLTDPPGSILSTPSVARGANGTAYLFVRTSSGIQLRTLTNFNSWSSWSTVLSNSTATVFPSISATADDSNANIILAGKDGDRFAVMTKNLGGWSGIKYPGGKISLTPSVTYAAGLGTAHYFRNGYSSAGDNTIWYRRQ